MKCSIILGLIQVKMTPCETASFRDVNLVLILTAFDAIFKVSNRNLFQICLLTHLLIRHVNHL